MKLTTPMLLGLLAVDLLAGVDVPGLQEKVDQGRPEEAVRTLNREVAERSRDPYLLYNRAVALYAAGKFEEALVDLDLVEDSRRTALVNKARFQKGNAHFRLGLASIGSDPELTLSRWRQSIGEYHELLKREAGHADARANHNHVQKRLLDLLLKLGAKNLAAAEKTRAMDQKITGARAAMEEFHEATETDPENGVAKDGERRARELLANTLAQEGDRKTLSTNLVAAARHEPPVARPDTAQIEEGVNMLQDAHGLKPEDASIKEKLERGQDRLADALTTQAQIYQNLEPRIPRVDEKLGILRMAMELLEKAISERQRHQRAQAALEQVKRRLAEVHEMEGDRLEQQARQASLEQQTQNLSNALDHFQQASALQPQQSQLPQKAQDAQARLEQALEKLGDRLMKAPPGQESLDQQVMRMEGASQAFNELESLKPTPQTSEKAEAASQALEQLRKQLAESGQPQPQPGGKEPSIAQAPQDNDGVPMDTPPRLDTKGKSGRYQSGPMNRSLRDY